MGFRGAPPVATVTAGTGVAIGGTATAPIIGISSAVALVDEHTNTVVASGAAQAIPDVTTATLNRITLTANCTFTFPAAAAGKSFMVALVQDATGSRTATWPANVKWAGGTAPTLTTTAGKVDVFSFICFDGANWLGVTVAENY